MQVRRFAAPIVAAAAGMLVAAASAATMHPVFGAHLMGMGEHGSVNFQSQASKGRLCWTFDVMADGVTGASIRDGAGMTVLALGNGFKAKSCVAAPASTLSMIESKLGSYQVWVATKGHPGDLRGRLSAGMAHM